MKSVLLYANQDSGLEARLQAALDVARRFGGHLSCLQVTPYNSFIMGDPFGGVYALPSVAMEVAEADDRHREDLEQRLRGEGVSWDWSRFDGQPAQLIVDRSRLADLIVLSLAADRDDALLPVAADVALHARSLVLAMPRSSRSFDGGGPALVAWNGSAEAANALRLALPMLATAAQVDIVTIAEDDAEFPSTDAAEYLSRHGVRSELHERHHEGRTTCHAIIDTAQTLGAAYVVMGAYGHSRLREAVLGGATRDMMDQSPLPLLLGH
ncbi:universal stress protein [Sphingosinicella rhizophila]|uniref:Universal stress protein n=1 Tax=Sphingosinicella rhizophila TaxID=3050082 RepID=A0ABU3Q7B8_9SPHN|nr:universal stress protein [Sphingosinicella sp. GR2756]MDT9598999.1 universal stress protein [Sphingosinicella sp. GR2756]